MSRYGYPFPGASATASSVAEGDDADSANNVLYQNTDLVWRSGEGDDQWLEIDIGKVKTIIDFQILWGAGANAKDYNVEFSEDGVNYETYVVARGRRATYSNDATRNVRRDTITFGTPHFYDSVRYVRIHMMAPNFDNGYVINEVSLFGHDDMDYTYDAADYVPNHVVPIYTLYATPRIFSGWYYDEDFNIPFTGDHGLTFGRFVDQGILTYKHQDKTDHTALRFVSSVGATDFQEVGFKFTGHYGDKTITEKKKSIQTVYRKIKADGETMLPSIFSVDSEYFFTYTIRNLNPNISTTDMSFEVTPYWVTHDGTEVDGVTGHYTIDGQSN